MTVRRTGATGLLAAGILWATAVCGAAEGWGPASGKSGPVPDAVATLLKLRCVKCHGPARIEAALNLALPAGIRRGGKSGAVVRPGNPNASLLWRRVEAGSMPPGEPLDGKERETLRGWMAAGAPGLPEAVSPRPDGEEHWAFRKLQSVRYPPVRDASRLRTTVDRFIQARLEAAGLTLAPEADPGTLIRRVAFDLTGLPPTPEERTAYLRDAAPGAYARMVDRYLASPYYGERWGKHWLDAAGYADSNGYFSADTDRPLAYRYRDYVIRSISADVPWDRFIREQLAGDELAGYRAGQEMTPERIALLEATHFLRNAPDGTDSSDGNPDEQRADKYAVLEGTLQMMGSALLGMTVQCARCHDHKFEPLRQREYYQLQAALYPAFNVEKWVQPARREIVTASTAELADWEARTKEVDRKIAGLRSEFGEWVRRNGEPSRVVFSDDFDGAGQRLASDWSNTVPGDAAPAGQPPVQVDADTSPGARIRDGHLQIRESGGSGDRVLSTRRKFRWAPEAEGAWISATFDLVAEGRAAPYVGYFLALRDFNDTTAHRGGNVLLDGSLQGKAAVHVDYPGAGSEGRGSLGQSGYTPGRRYGVRVTNIGNGRYEVSQVVDGTLEPGTVELRAEDLPDGGFGFEFCCGRSFVVDNVRIEESDPSPGARARRLAAAEALRKRRADLDTAIKALEGSRPPKPGRVAAVTDLAPEPPEVRLLERGEYKRPGEKVRAAAPAFLLEPGAPAEWTGAGSAGSGTGRRPGFARWLTEPGSRPAALLARVTVNRWWGHHFGTALAPTPDNLGYSGTSASHPELLEYLAGRLIASGWSGKALHREILLSAVYRQQSRAPDRAARVDPDNRLLSHFPLRRLDAEAVRDAMLALSGDLDPAAGGTYVPTSRDRDGDVVVNDSSPGARRRSVYLQQRRTQVLGVLQVFDAPSITVNCTSRIPTTVPLQSLKLLNSAFVRARARGLAERLTKRGGADVDVRLALAFELVAGRAPRPPELAAATEFITAQRKEYAGRADAELPVWQDFCQMLLASNAFLYVE